MKSTWTLWIIALTLYIGCSIINVTLYRVKNIFKIEFAPSSSAMQNYILEIDSASPAHSYHLLEMNTVVDYIYILSYSLLSFFSFKLLLNVFDASGGLWIYVFSMLAGFFDCLENIFLMSSAIRQREDFSWLYYDIVRIKWAFAITPLMIIPITILYSLIIAFRYRAST